jgi:type II secretory pathway predicted ATPase ExeA
MNTTAEPPIDMDAQLKSLWGAGAWPFTAAVKEVMETDAYARTLQRLEQCMAVRTCGILWGPNGVGKSRLVKTLVDRLPKKSYRTMILTHSSLTGTDITRYLCHTQGIGVTQRRSDNLMSLRKLWSDQDGLWPVLIFEEAQNLSTMALEELRLMTCDRLDTQPPFSLLLVGDGALLPRLQMGINRPLLSRMGFCLELPGWPPEQCARYLAKRLADVGIRENVFDPEAEQLLLRIAGGIPRTINHLGQRSFEEAARNRSRQIRIEHVQHALEQLPWLGAIHND